MTTSRVSPATGRSPNSSFKWCVAFSTITIAWSTRMPTEMVMPASDMTLAWMSMTPSLRNTHIIRNENSTASGRVIQITNALRRWVKMSSMATEAMSISCHITSPKV